MADVSLERENARSVAVAMVALGVLLAAVLAGIVIVPGDVAAKTRAALHGLCAQRSSHSIQLGNQTLPLDARMTGIYLSAAVTLVWLAISGRLRAAGRVPLRVTLTLGVFVVVMALDGSNALLVDLGLRPLYEPSNLLRIATGTLAGVSFGALLGYLFATTAWASGDHARPLITRPGEIAAPLVISAVLGAIVLGGWAMLYTPVAVGLVVCAIGVCWFASVSLLILAQGRAWRANAYRDLAITAVTALAAAIVFVGALAGLRFLAEAWLSLPRLT